MTDRNGCRQCSTYSCEPTTTCRQPICALLAAPLCAKNTYLEKVTRVDPTSGCSLCPSYTCKPCPSCPIGLALCAPGYRSVPNNVTDSNGCVCTHSTCVRDTCDATVPIRCPVQAAPVCADGEVVVTTQPDKCSCPTVSCKRCPVPSCVPPPAVCADGRAPTLQHTAEGCPTCKACSTTTCPAILCAALAPSCRNNTVVVKIPAEKDENGCATSCDSAVCCEAPVCPLLAIRCPADTTAVTIKKTDSRGCPACSEQKCVPIKTTCDEPICVLGFPSCRAPQVLKREAQTDANNCPTCPKYSCVDPAQCGTRVCPAIAMPECPDGSSPVQVRAEPADSCDDSCPTWSCEKAPECPLIACPAVAQLVRCAPGETLQTIAQELPGGCKGCPTARCVPTKCNSVALICPLALVRCSPGTVAVTTTPKDEQGCDMCPVTRCVKPDPTPCPRVACPQLAIRCKAGFHVETVEQFDDRGCQGCPQQTCVRDACVRAVCPAVAACATDGKRVTTAFFDENGCPTCPRVDCFDDVCPLLRCPDVAPTCKPGQVPRRIAADASDTRCPTCAQWECVEKTCKPSAVVCPAVECSDGERRKAVLDADGCEVGCARCVPVCDTQCDGARPASMTCASGAPNRVIGTDNCCKWACVNDDAIVKDTPARPDESTAAHSSLTIALAALLLVTIAL